MSTELVVADLVCRACGASDLQIVLSLGLIALANAFVPIDKSGGLPEPRYPLDLAFCSSCALVQILYTVSPNEMFEEYVYFSSVSNELLGHSREHAGELVARRGLGPESLVVEVASNDGYLLRNFVDAGIPVLGIDPARGPAEAAEAIGVPTLREFFGAELASRLRSEGYRADVLIANNVLAHVPDLHGFVEGIAIILADHGIAEIEVPYVRDLIDNLEFDTIYHEHLCYFSVTTLDSLFRSHGLSLNDVRHLAIHGGSLRLTIGHQSNVADSVGEFLREEAAVGLPRINYYRGFSDRVKEAQRALRDMLEQIKRSDRRIAAYGAAAKGTVLLTSSGIGSDLIDFVVDKSPQKQGHLMPGVGIPIGPPLWILQRAPDYVLLLAWNFKDEIMREQRAYLDAGGRFILPIPAPVQVGKEDLPSALSG